jgi:hypothetical protein
MNRLRCVLFAAIVVIFSTTFAMAGDMQGPGKSNPTPTPTPTSLTTVSTSDDLTEPTSTEELQIVWQEASMTLIQSLLTIF